MKQQPYTIALVVVCLWNSVVAIGDELARKDRPEVKIMSFNIRYGTARDGENQWNNRKEFVAETIKAFEPDLLGTQETLAFQKEYLQKQLPAYTSLGVGRDDGAAKGEMTAIFYRTTRFEKLAEGHFWLSEIPKQVGSKSWDSSLPRICSWVKLRDRESGTKPILFLNTHFDHRGKKARYESAKLIRRQAQKLGVDCNVILTGDFNAAVDSAPYQALFFPKTSSPARESETQRLRFVDTYKAAGTESAQGEATFSGFRSGQVVGARIDWIAADTGWETLQAGIDRTARDGRTPSDHYPVTATLRRHTSTVPK